MSNQKQNNPYNNFNNRKQHIIFAKIYKRMQAFANKANANKKQTQSPKIEKGSGGIKWTDIGMLLVNVILAYYTYKLFDIASDQMSETRKATNAAIQSANAADSTYRQQRFNDSITRRRDSINDVASGLIENKKFKIQYKALQTQIESVNAQSNSIQETQRQFDIANAPYLQIENFKIEVFEAGKYPVIIFKIVNLGNYPAKILDAKTALFYTKTLSLRPIKDMPTVQPASMSTYITKESPSAFVLEFNKIVTSDRLKEIKNGDLDMYLSAEIIYVNEINKQKKVYSFTARFASLNTFPGHEMLYNNNQEIK